MVIPPNNIGKGAGGVPSNQSGGVTSRNDAGSATRGAGADKEAASAGDAVSLSSQGQKLARMEASMTQHSEIDEAKVAALKQLVDSGRYQVDSQSVAKRMLDMDTHF